MPYELSQTFIISSKPIILFRSSIVNKTDVALGPDFPCVLNFSQRIQIGFSAMMKFFVFSLSALASCGFGFIVPTCRPRPLKPQIHLNCVAPRSFRVKNEHDIKFVHLHNSFGELVKWARDVTCPEHPFADIQLSVSRPPAHQDWERLKESTWETLSPLEVYNLNVSGLPHEFSAFKENKHDPPFEYSVDHRLGANFPEPANRAAFEDIVTQILNRVDQVTKLVTLASDGSHRGVIQDLVAPFLYAAAKLVNDENCCSRGAAATHPEISVEYGTSLEGTFAYGKLDVALYFKRFAFVVLMADHLGEFAGTGAHHVLSAQMITMKERLLRAYATLCPQQSLEEVKRSLDRIPVFGVVSSGDRWQFMRCVGSKESYYMTLSDKYYLSVQRDISPAMHRLREEQVRAVLSFFYGALSVYMKSAADFHAKVL